MSYTYKDKEVQKLADEFIKFKRYVEDSFENLDESNFSGSFKKMVAKYSNTSSAGFEAYADSESAFTKMFAEFKNSIAEIKEEASENNSKISIIANWKNEVDEELGDINDNVAKIELTTDKNNSIISLMTSAGGGKPEDETDIANLYIMAMNNHSEIKLNANVVKFGDYAAVDNTGNFYAKKIFGFDSDGKYVVNGDNYPGFFFAEISSDYKTLNGYGADLCVKSISYFSDDLTTGDTLMYGFMFGETNKQGLSLNFSVGELYGDTYKHDEATASNDLVNKRELWGYNYKQKVLFPKGVWDFSSCVVENLGVVPVFG